MKKKKTQVQQNFLKFTAQKMKFRLIDTEDKQLEQFKVKALDRMYQFWERNPLSIDLWNRSVFFAEVTIHPQYSNAAKLEIVSVT